MANEIELLMSGQGQVQRKSQLQGITAVKNEVIQDMLASVEARDDQIRKEGKSCLARPVD
ncbi:hypothetical protein GQ473_03620 [archaeon]|nr:hypothetical protein [archaeon]